MFGEVGNNAFGEVQAVKRFGSIEDKIKTIIKKEGEGLLTGKAIAEITTLTRQFKNVGIESLNYVVKQHKSTFEDAYGEAFKPEK